MPARAAGIHCQRNLYRNTERLAQPHIEKSLFDTNTKDSPAMLLDHILKPRAVAVVGASTRPHTIGNDLLKRLLEYGFKGHIYPVNPKGGEIEGLRAYTSVSELPDGVDLAVIVVNAKFVLSTVDECAARGIKGLVVISAGFKETGGEGRELEEALAAKVRANGMRMVPCILAAWAVKFYRKLLISKHCIIDCF